MNLKISIILPIYNVENYLSKCLESIASQSLKDIEIICINDGSTDKSLEIIKDFAHKDNRFIIINQKNKGTGVCRNIGLSIAKGEYIFFIDPDDYIANNALKKLYDFAKINNSEVVHFNFFEHNETTNIIKEVSFSKFFKARYHYDLEKNPFYHWKKFKKNCLIEHDLHVWNHLYKREFILKNNIKFAPTVRCEDHIFSISAKLLAKKIDYLNDYLYFYRRRNGSAVNSRNNNNFCIFDNINLVKNFIIQNNLWNDLKKEYEKYEIKVIFWHYHQTPLKRLQEYKDTCKIILGRKNFKKFINLIKGKKLLSIKRKILNGRKYKIIYFWKFKYIYKKDLSL